MTKEKLAVAHNFLNANFSSKFKDCVKIILEFIILSTQNQYATTKPMPSLLI